MSERTAPGADSWRVIIAEDEAFDRAEAKAALLRGSTRRYTFVECETGAEVLAALADGPPVACLLLDYHLPDVDAPELLAALPSVHAAEGLPTLLEVPVVVVTGADSDAEGAERSSAVLQAGAQEFVGKDWLTPASLTRAVESARERYGMARRFYEQQRALQRSESRMRHLAEALPQIVFIAGPDGRRDYVSPQWQAYTGQAVEQALGRGYLDFLHPDDVPVLADARDAAMQKGEPYQVEFRLRRSDGAYRWFLTRAVPVEDDAEGLTRWFGTSTDIHDRRAATEVLEQAVQARTQELERSNAELDQFAYIASHDLKAPLRAIDSLAKWIGEDVADALPNESRRHLQTLRSRVGRMERLLDDLLEYSRVDRAPSPPEPVDTAALLRSVVALLGLPEGFTVELEGPFPTVETQRAPLEMVFRNLIGNAIKHHDRERGRIVVRALPPGALEPEADGALPKEGAQATGPPYVIFRVADDGPGIPPAYHDRIFGLFQTLRPRDDMEASGMGLAIVKKALDSRGGRITVETGTAEDGRGTAFTFLWPLRGTARNTARGSA